MGPNTVSISANMRTWRVDYDGKSWNENNLPAAIRSAFAAAGGFSGFELVLDTAAAKELATTFCLDEPNI